MVLARTYGEAAAIELLGPDRGIPGGTVLSGHNSFVAWWPDEAPEGTVITVRYRPAELHRFFESCTVVGTVTNDHDVENEVSGSPIMVCEDLTVSGAELRDALAFTR